MGRLRGHMVYKVIATEFLSLREPAVHDPDEDTYLSYIKTLLATGPLYFSYSIDVTNSFQRQAASDISQPLWKRADDRFFWNRFVQAELIEFGTGRSGSGLRGSQPGVDPYILPVMFGMMQIVRTKVKSTSFTFALITRRSRFRGGTRYFSRGIDSQGHVSNYNETEQVVLLNDNPGEPSGFAGGAGMQNDKIGGNATSETQVMSYVQTRGSVPVFWTEANDLHYTPKLQIRGIETAVDAARKHFKEQIDIYGENYLVNLVNQRGREDRVKKAYEQMVRILMSSPTENHESDLISDVKLDRLHYIYFDFHNMTKGLRWHRAQLLLDQLAEGLIRGQYFRGVEMPGDPNGALETRLQQTAVVRTNCMDCLDRTNVVQSMLARWTLTRQLLDVGVLKPGESSSDDPIFEDVFRNIWADNADIVSKSYSGTGALKTDFTRTGNRTRAGMMQDLNNSITRYVYNNFMDGPRQDGFDLFLGAYIPPSAGAGSSMHFIDRRPLVIRSIPYVLAACVFIITLSSLTRRPPDSTVWPIRTFLLLCFAIGVWSLQFIYGHGMLYVNWPKLNTPPAGIEGYQEAMARARKDKVIGQFIQVADGGGRRARNVSMSKIGYMEEGKKRIE